MIVLLRCYFDGTELPCLGAIVCGAEGAFSLGNNSLFLEEAG
ncbi:MAG: hypothetical protein ACYTEL_25325 [Planctomycetota bacterium]|jgi:hypothetical protein